MLNVCFTSTKFYQGLTTLPDPKGIKNDGIQTLPVRQK